MNFLRESRLRRLSRKFANWLEEWEPRWPNWTCWDASYRIGVLYTGLMPDERRARLGAHYTPRALCQRLLDMAEEAGVKWATARVLDPACGGGAFLSPLALRIAASLKDQPAEAVLTSIEQRLRGYEIDPFAAWMSQVFLDVTLAKPCLKAGRPLKSLVQVCDALEQEPGAERFDLVIGNPPYGRITLSPSLRQKFRRSLSATRTCTACSPIWRCDSRARKG